MKELIESAAKAVSRLVVDESKGEMDELSTQIRQEALQVLENEPELTHLLQQTVLAPWVVTFEDAVASTVAHRLLSKSSVGPIKDDETSLRSILRNAMDYDDILESNYTMSSAIREDALCVW
jgi:hypothetical protein